MEIKNMKLTLDALHDDCLECIFCRITDLNTQIQVSKVCQRFRDIYARMWRCNPAYHCLCLEEWSKYDLSAADFEYFMNIVHDTVRDIKLIAYDLQDFLKEVQALQINCFPKVKSFGTENVMDAIASDTDIKMLAQLIPNVKILSLTQALTGRYLRGLQELQELYLYHDYDKEYELKNQYLQEILEKSTRLRVLDIRSYEMSNLDLCAIEKCTQLQVLKLNLNVLKPVLGKVLALPQLKRLTVLLDNVIDVSRIDNVDNYDYKIYETAEFYYILEHKSDKITGLSVDNFFMPLASNWDAKLNIFNFRKLTKVAIANYEYSDEILEKYANMKELRMLCCRNWPQLTNETVLKIVESCPKLEHLDIAYCRGISNAFLPIAFKALKAQKQRKCVLNIYYTMSSIDEYNMKEDKWSSVIKLINGVPPDSDKGLSFVQRGFEFDFE